jgi:flagellar secretion chaperone FliS
VIAAHASMFVAAGGQALGFSTFASDDALVAGAHSITVSQASGAAMKSGDSALAGSTADQVHQRPGRIDGTPRHGVRDQAAPAVRDTREHDLDPEVPEQLHHQPGQLAQRQYEREVSDVERMPTSRRNGFPMNQTMLRAAYVTNSIDAMSSGRAVVALYERLTLDIERAGQAIDRHDIGTAHECLLHAQAIVSELHDSLDVERWPAAQNLKSIYVFLLFELVHANVEKDAARVTSCHALVAPLREAWSEAAGIVTIASGGAQ